MHPFYKVCKKRYVFKDTPLEEFMVTSINSASNEKKTVVKRNILKEFDTENFDAESFGETLWNIYFTTKELIFV